MTRFRLLQLPSLALQVVLEFLDPFELFDLSQCSRKSAAIVPLGGTRQYKLSFFHDGVYIDKYLFKAALEKHETLMGKRKLPLNNGKEIYVYVGRYCGYFNERNFYFVDRNLGLKVILFHLVELFGCRVDSIAVSDPFSFGIYRSIIDWVIKKQKEIRRLVIGRFLNEYAVRWILDNLPITNTCECAVQTSLNFEYKFKTYPRTLYIDFSHWFRLEDLFAAAKSCVVISLSESRLNNKDIDVFMKSWTSGDFPALRFFQVRSWNLNKRDQILGRNPAEWWKPEADFSKDIELDLDLILGRNPDQWWYDKKVVGRERIKIDSDLFGIDNGVKFQRDDGIEAKIEMNFSRYCFTLMVL